MNASLLKKYQFIKRHSDLKLLNSSIFLLYKQSDESLYNNFFSKTYIMLYRSLELQSCSSKTA